MRFVLIDRITDFQPNASISALKNLSLAEEYLADHFPGFPVMPGVLMVEALVQTGAWLIRQARDYAESTVVLREVKAVRYNNFVAPGHTLHLTMAVKKQAADAWEFQGTGTVDGTPAVSAKLSLEFWNLADRNPDLADADAAAREHHRALWAQLWRPGATVG